MFDVGGAELLVIIFAVLLFFGPRRLPDVARTIGKGMAYLRRAQSEFQRNLHGISDEIESAASLNNVTKHSNPPTNAPPEVQPKQSNSGSGAPQDEPTGASTHRPDTESNVRIQPAADNIPRNATTTTTINANATPEDAPAPNSDNASVHNANNESANDKIKDPTSS